VTRLRLGASGAEKLSALGAIGRFCYGETRIICYGHLQGRLVVVGYVPRGASRHIFSMRKANAREQERLAPYLEI
jgi:uncharacterized DUF497 family protein